MTTLLELELISKLSGKESIEQLVPESFWRNLDFYVDQDLERIPRGTMINVKVARVVSCASLRFFLL